jgi:hypothetical protein
MLKKLEMEIEAAKSDREFAKLRFEAELEERREERKVRERQLRMEEQRLEISILELKAKLGSQG